MWARQAPRKTNFNIFMHQMNAQTPGSELFYSISPLLPHRHRLWRLQSLLSYTWDQLQTCRVPLALLQHKATHPVQCFRATSQRKLLGSSFPLRKEKIQLSLFWASLQPCSQDDASSEPSPATRPYRSSTRWITRGVSAPPRLYTLSKEPALSHKHEDETMEPQEWISQKIPEKIQPYGWYQSASVCSKRHREDQLNRNELPCSCCGWCENLWNVSQLLGYVWCEIRKIKHWCVFWHRQKNSILTNNSYSNYRVSQVRELLVVQALFTFAPN